MSEHEKKLGYTLRELRIVMNRYIDAKRAKLGYDDISFAQGGIVHYLHRNQDHPVYQKDIEQEFHIQRSTATGILKLLEQRGSIRRVSEKKDARLKRIEVTEKARLAKKRVDSTIEGVEKKLVRGLTEKEIKTYIELTEKMRRNLEE